MWNIFPTHPRMLFIKKLFNYLFKHQEERGAVYTISYVYAPLFEGDAIRLAIDKQIPLVLAGYSPGQPEPERMLYEFSHKLLRQTDWTPPALIDSGAFSEEELKSFYNARHYPARHELPALSRTVSCLGVQPGTSHGVGRQVQACRQAHGTPIRSSPTIPSTGCACIRTSGISATTPTSRSSPH